ncbi:hypothetical protein PAXRUDRAFT_802662 [Paxillus rubicundulus Ve08.2h10]|uniref:Uncharacterized protein n=1 Tax=Paxillus rubicundulus Ve08.2h10 TaxID=930991 RepID=A0A0D0DBR0_9AGAM|nr:hypothetical protein PAXRUDRAFT_802662 [Paxillus rubicundulus Ve08.2h10]
MWNSSHLENPDIANEIHEHLQSIGKYVHAQDIVDYLDKEDVRTWFGMKKTIALATAKHWMHRMDYQWTCNFKDDVIWYHKNVFLKQWAEIEEFMHTWDSDESTNNTNFPADSASLPPKKKCIWFHDESLFYVNDFRTAQWVHKYATATPYTKGEGASLMVANFVLVDHGWLHSPDRKESARVLFKAGKLWDGYFTNDNIVAQAQKAIKLVKEDFPDEDHILVFNNVMTHLKRADDALSAHKMPKHPLKEGTNWGIKSLYFPDGHPHAGIFKGMVIILKEHGYCDTSCVHAECPDFICDPTVEQPAYAVQQT